MWSVLNRVVCRYSNLLNILLCQFSPYKAVFPPIERLKHRRFTTVILATDNVDAAQSMELRLRQPFMCIGEDVCYHVADPRVDQAGTRSRSTLCDLGDCC